MNPKDKPETTLMTLLVTPLDRALLNLICEQDGRAAMSATVRRLIRQEADRRGIDPATVTLPTMEAEQPA